MKVVFLGTPSFAVPVLDAICNSKHKVLAVVTQPDRKSGRHMTVTYSPVKELALEKKLPVYQPENISKELEDTLRSLKPDCMVTAAYGQILKQNILDICPIYNVHASILPKYRGSSPVQWALINGDEEVGVTIMKTELGIDTGDILNIKATKLNGNENAEETLEILSKLGSTAIIEALDALENGTAVFTKQDDSKATHCKMLDKEDGLLDFSDTALNIYNKMRGLNPWPSTFTYLNGSRLKVMKAEIIDYPAEVEPGTVVVANYKEGIIVKTKDKCLRLIEIQPENGKKMLSTQYLLGKKVEEGTILG